MLITGRPNRIRPMKRGNKTSRRNTKRTRHTHTKKRKEKKRKEKNQEKKTWVTRENGRARRDEGWWEEEGRKTEEEEEEEEEESSRWPPQAFQTSFLNGRSRRRRRIIKPVFWLIRAVLDRRNVHNKPEEFKAKKKTNKQTKKNLEKKTRKTTPASTPAASRSRNAPVNQTRFCVLHFSPDWFIFDSVLPRFSAVVQGLIVFYWVLSVLNRLLLGFSLRLRKVLLVFFWTWSNWTAYNRVLLGFTGFFWALSGWTAFYWVFLWGYGRFWLLLGFTGFHCL